MPGIEGYCEELAGALRRLGVDVKGYILGGRCVLDVKGRMCGELPPEARWLCMGSIEVELADGKAAATGEYPAIALANEEEARAEVELPEGCEIKGIHLYRVDGALLTHTHFKCTDTPEELKRKLAQIIEEMEWATRQLTRK